jgi:NTP pyrophosphatase (non-canonical NTP hydrolase)
VTTHFNKLTPAQAERLAILAEECGEIIQVVGKILRHGYDSHNPYAPVKVTNRELLERELGDVLVAFGLLADRKDISSEVVSKRCDIKEERIKEFLHHQEWLTDKVDNEQN